MPVPILTVEQMRQWEAASWESEIIESDVIAKVGHLVALRALALTKPDDLILLLAGKGHNGDDVRAAEQYLKGRKVKSIDVVSPTTQLPDLDAALKAKPALIVDGLFGIGLNRPLKEPWCKFINTINAARRPVLAVDVPTGLDAQTGEPLGAAVEATITLVVGTPKTGLMEQKALPYVGKLEVANDVGLLLPCPIKEEWNWTLTEDFAGLPPLRRIDSHKGTFGHVVILAGSLGYHGAAVLAARGALAAMPGLVTVVTMEEVYLPVASQLQAAMVHPWLPQMKLPASATAIVMGPGLAAEDLPDQFTDELAELWKSSALPVIADASALNWLPAGSVESSAARVIIPHPGEAARLLDRKSSEVQSSRLEAMRALSQKFGNCWVALKGHQTVVGRSNGDAFVNCSGNPGLAQGGSGDVLAGHVGGILAQAAFQQDPGLALRYAVWNHGNAADRLAVQRRTWTVEDLILSLSGSLGS